MPVFIFGRAPNLLWRRLGSGASRQVLPQPLRFWGPGFLFRPLTLIVWLPPNLRSIQKIALFTPIHKPSCLLKSVHINRTYSEGQFSCYYWLRREMIYSLCKELWPESLKSMHFVRNKPAPHRFLMLARKSVVPLAAERFWDWKQVWKRLDSHSISYSFSYSFSNSFSFYNPGKAFLLLLLPDKRRKKIHESA